MKTLFRKFIELFDLVTKSKPYLNNKVLPGVTASELVRTPDNIDRVIFQLISENNRKLHQADQFYLHQPQQTYLKNLAPLLFKIVDLRKGLEERIKKTINRNDIFDISIKKLIGGEKPAMFIYAFFMEDLQPQIVLIRPDEIDGYDGTKYLQACKSYSLEVFLEKYFKEYLADTVELRTENIADILHPNGIYDPNYLTVAESEALAKLNQKLKEAYPYKVEGHEIPDLNRVIVDIYESIKADPDLVEQLANGYFIFRSKYKLANEPLQFLEYRDLITHYLVQVSALEKYALGNIRDYLAEEGSFTDMREIERFQNKSKQIKHKLLGFYSLEHTAELIQVLKNASLDKLKEEVKAKIKTGLAYTENLFEKMTAVYNKISQDYGEEETRETFARPVARSTDNEQTVAVAEQPVASSSIYKIIDYFTHNYSLKALAAILLSGCALFVGSGIYVGGRSGLLISILGSLVSFILALFFSWENAPVAQKNIDQKSKSKTQRINHSKGAGKAVDFISPKPSKIKVESNSLGAKNDQLVENCIKTTIKVAEEELLPKVILTEEGLANVKEKIEKILLQKKDLKVFTKIQIYKRMNELLRPLEIPLDHNNALVKQFPQEYRWRKKIYILVPGVKPLDFLKELTREYYREYDRKAPPPQKALYAYVLKIAEEKIRSNGNGG